MDRWTERRLRGQPQRERRNEADARRAASAGALSDRTLTYFELKFNFFFPFQGREQKNVAREAPPGAGNRTDGSSLSLAARPVTFIQHMTP